MIKTGQEYMFFYRHEDDDSEVLAPHHGERCTVTRTVRKDDADIPFGGVFEVRFGDSSEASVYGDELNPVIQIGQKYRFVFRHEDDVAKSLAPRNGQQCTVLMAEKQIPADIPLGGVFDICFGDGSEATAYGDELASIA